MEMALAELSSHRQQDQRRAAAVDAAAGIDAFEMTLKRLGASAGSNTGGVSWLKAAPKSVSWAGSIMQVTAHRAVLPVCCCLCRSTRSCSG